MPIELSTMLIKVSMGMSGALGVVLRLSLVVIHGHLLDLRQAPIEGMRSHLWQLLS